MKTMYIAHLSMRTIEDVAVVKETPKTVSIQENGRSRLTTTHKNTERHVVCGSWAEAHAVLLAKARMDLIKSKQSVLYYEKKLQEVENMS